MLPWFCSCCGYVFKPACQQRTRHPSFLLPHLSLPLSPSTHLSRPSLTSSPTHFSLSLSFHSLLLPSPLLLLSPSPLVLLLSPVPCPPRAACVPPSSSLHPHLLPLFSTLPFLPFSSSSPFLVGGGAARTCTWRSSQSGERGRSEVVVDKPSLYARGTCEGELSVIVGFGFLLPPHDLILGSSCGREAGCSEHESCSLRSSCSGRASFEEGLEVLGTVVSRRRSRWLSAGEDSGCPLSQGAHLTLCF